MYARRRARSAVASSTRPETLTSTPTPTTTPLSERRGQTESLQQDQHQTNLFSSRSGLNKDEQLRPGSKGSHSSTVDEKQHDKSAQTSPAALTPLARFRLLVWITVCMRRLFVEIIRLSGEKTLRSATELQWMAVYAEKHDASLAFNKHLFSRDRVMAHVPFWAQCILAIPPVDRSVTHCRKLHALLRGLRSFDKFTDEIQMALCKAFSLEKYVTV
ncbi:cyclic nucleotide-binding domain-containing protein 2-like [Elysia marginata]|uniref:Cyclic nucleotide-binding domain-containing protein 2-like n=1 Tax=Elysia marginata TaxID=1093978 RepID=A0AAV4ELU9_9GAST|nr:cyclic nucleotide-binding domain-containing protein 2-like [Elysia marginata]